MELQYGTYFAFIMSKNCTRTLRFCFEADWTGFFSRTGNNFAFFLGGGVDYEDDISPDMFAACASFWHKSDSESSRWHCAPSDGSGSRSLSERLSRRGCKAAWRFR